MKKSNTDQLVQQIEFACSETNYRSALNLYGDALMLDPKNAILYSNRSAIYCEIGDFESALRDAEACCKLRPTWSKALYNKAYALKCLGSYEESIIIFAQSLISHPENVQLKAGLLECLAKNPFTRGCQFIRNPTDFKFDFGFLSNLARKFVDSNYQETGMLLLECCLKFDTVDFNDIVNVSELLMPIYVSRGLIERCNQLLINNIEISKNTEISIKSLSNDRNSEIFALIYGCLTNIGNLHLKMENFDDAEDVLLRKLVISVDELKDEEKQYQSLISLGLMHLKANNFEKSRRLFLDAFRTSQTIGNKGLIEVHLCGYLATVNLAMKKFDIARRWAEKKLHLTLNDGNLAGIAEACGILGLIEFSTGFKGKYYNPDIFLFGYEKITYRNNAKKLFQRQLELANQISDKNILATAYVNLAKISSNSDALIFNTERLDIYKEVNDLNGQLACLAEVAFSALEIYITKRNSTYNHNLRYFDIAENHIKCYINLARSRFHLDEKDRKSQSIEMKVFRNCGVFYEKASIFPVALEFFERFLMTAQECGSLTMEKSACSMLGTVHRKLRQHREAARYFRQELSLAKELRDHESMSECYRNLCLVHIDALDLDESTECAKYFAALAHIVGSQTAKLEALCLMGDTLSTRRKFSLALKLYAKYLKAAKSASSSTKLGDDGEKDAIYHQCLAYGRLGSTFDSLANHKQSKLCFEVQFSIAKEKNNLSLLFDAVYRICDHYKLSGDMNLLESILQLLRGKSRIRRSSILYESKVMKKLGEIASKESTKPSISYRNADKFFRGRLSIIRKLSETELHRNTEVCLLFKDALFDYANFLIKNRQYLRCLAILEKNFDGLTLNNKPSFDIFFKIAQLRFTTGCFEQSAFLYEVILFYSYNFDIGEFEKCEIHFNLAVCYLYTLNWKLCQTNLEIGLYMAEKCQFFELKCKIYLVLSKFKENYAEKAIEFAKEKNLKDILCEIYSFLSNYGLNRDYVQRAAHFVCNGRSELTYIKSLAYCTLDVNDLRTCIELAEKLDMNSELEVRLVLSIILWSRGQFEELKQQLDYCHKISENFDVGYESCFDFFLAEAEYVLSLPILSCIFRMLFYLKCDESRVRECVQQLLYANEIKETRNTRYSTCITKSSELKVFDSQTMLIHFVIEKWLFVFSKDASRSERFLFAGLRSPLEFCAHYHIGFDLSLENRRGSSEKFLFIDCDVIYHQIKVSTRFPHYILNENLTKELLHTKCQFLYSPFRDDEFSNSKGPKITYDKLFTLEMNCELVFVFDDRNLLLKNEIFRLAKKFQLRGCRNVVFFLKFKFIKAKLIKFFDTFAEKSKKCDYIECLTETLDMLDADLDDVIIFGDMVKGVSLFNRTEVTNPYRLLLETPDECRRAMLIVLHLVEKSLKCLKSNENRRFTDETSIKNKVGPEVRGVFQLLTSLGFERKIYRCQNEHVWYFPEKSCLNLLEKASKRLLSFLGLDRIDSREEINILRSKRLELTRTKLQHTLCCIDALLEKSTDVDEVLCSSGDFPKLENSEFVLDLLVKNYKIQIQATENSTHHKCPNIKKLPTLKKSNTKKYATMHHISSKKQNSTSNINDGYKSDAEINNHRKIDKDSSNYLSQNNSSNHQRLLSTNNLNTDHFCDENSDDCDEIFHSVREALEKFRVTKIQKSEYARLETPIPPQSDNDYIQYMLHEDNGNFCGNTVEYCSTTAFCGEYNIREVNTNFNLNISDTQMRLDLL
uniref:Uncharacterized protein n=1 Tax=Romanomermis culicivorax TaxID=13658 RepID=A0A915IEY0_ROMCU